MAVLIRIVYAIVMAMAMTMVACEQTITMKALVLTTAQRPLDTITLNLQSYGIPYDLITFSPEETFTGNLSLYNEKNEPKYNLIIINGGQLVYEVDNQWVSALSPEQWDSINEYEAKNSVRRVVFSENVSSCEEVELYEANDWGNTLDEQPLAIESSSEVKAIFQEARVKPDAPLNVNGIYHTRVKIVDTSTTTPFLYYEDKGNKGPVAATITKYPDGREKMSFYFDFANWSQTCIILNHLWLTWGTRSLFNGFRRVYFTPHIDDVFLSTRVVDPVNNTQDGTKTVRTTVEDFQRIAKFQKNILKSMPEGSLYRVELAYNGNGLLTGNYSTYLNVDGSCYVDEEFVMKPGGGDKLAF